MRDDRLERLKAKHKLVAAELAYIVACADARRTTTIALQLQTAELLEELRRQCARTRALQIKTGRGHPQPGRSAGSVAL